MGGEGERERERKNSREEKESKKIGSEVFLVFFGEREKSFHGILPRFFFILAHSENAPDAFVEGAPVCRLFR